MPDAKTNNTCMTIGSIVVAVVVGLIAYYVGTIAALWLAVLAFFILLAVGLWLVQKFCAGANRPAEDVPPVGAPMENRSDDQGAADSGAAVESGAPAAPLTDGFVEDDTTPAVKPATLDAARDGNGDDLKRIKGVGPKLEQMLKDMGFYQFDQIAGWTEKEVAWVDANLEGFTGRVTRDNWVEQAKTLAAGGETEFSKKVDKGGVY